jgi:phosphoglycolate phosphatase
MTCARLWHRSVIVFDLDGTLVDTLPDLHGALNAALASLELPPIPPELVRHSLHDGLEGSARAAGRALGLDIARIDALIDAYRRHYEAEPVRRSAAYPGVQAVLARLLARGRRLGVCTNKAASQAREVLRALGLLDAFDIVVGADSCAHRKPDPRPLLLAIDALDGRPADALLVGDSPVDTACARAAEVDCLIHAGGYGAAAADSTAGARHFASFEMLLSLDPDRR